MSAYDDNDLNAIDRLEDLLDAYCDARLAPRSAVLARIRANVIREAALASATTAATHRLRLVEPAPRRRWSIAPRFGRVAFTFGFAAILTLGTSAAVLAAPPGSPFYNARVFLETALLPAQIDDRLAGHEKLLEERLAEAEVAARQGDTVALEAALVAFQSEVDAAAKDAGTNVTLLAHLEDVLSKHTATLTALAAQLPAQASIENAILASSKAIAALQEKVHPTHPTHPGTGPGSGGGQSGGGNGGSGGTGGSGGSGGSGSTGSQGAGGTPAPRATSSPAGGAQNQNGGNEQ